MGKDGRLCCDVTDGSARLAGCGPRRIGDGGVVTAGADVVAAGCFRGFLLVGDASCC